MPSCNFDDIARKTILYHHIISWFVEMLFCLLKQSVPEADVPYPKRPSTTSDLQRWRPPPEARSPSRISSAGERNNVHQLRNQVRKPPSNPQTAWSDGVDQTTSEVRRSVSPPNAPRRAASPQRGRPTSGRNVKRRSTSGGRRNRKKSATRRTGGGGGARRSCVHAAEAVVTAVAAVNSQVDDKVTSRVQVKERKSTNERRRVAASRADSNGEDVVQQPAVSRRKEVSRYDALY